MLRESAEDRTLDYNPASIKALITLTDNDLVKVERAREAANLALLKGAMGKNK